MRRSRRRGPKGQPAAARTSGILIGVLCGTGAALGWAAGFVAAKHGITDRLLARRSRFPSLLLVRPAADAARLARRHRGSRRHRLGPRPGDERAVRPAAGDDRLYRLHAGAARPRHHHPARLRGAVRPDSRHSGAGRTPDRAARARRRDDHRRPDGVRRRIAYHHRQPWRRRRPAVRYRRPVLGDLRHAAALLARVGDACGGGRRRAVGRRVRAAVRGVCRLRQPAADGLGTRTCCRSWCRASSPACCRSICSRAR